MRAVLTIGVRGNRILWTGQVWKGAAINRTFCVPQGIPDRASCISSTYVTITIKGARFYIVRCLSPSILVTQKVSTLIKADKSRIEGWFNSVFYLLFYLFLTQSVNNYHSFIIHCLHGFPLNSNCFNFFVDFHSLLIRVEGRKLLLEEKWQREATGH